MEGAWKPIRRLQFLHRRGRASPALKAMPILAERYQLGDLIFSDAWVVAYRARDQVLSRDVTVELLRPQPGDAANHERLLAKGRRAALTSLPHVAAIYDQGTVDGRPFLVLEEPLGPSLADSVPLDTAAAVALIESLAAIQRSAIRRRQTIPALTPSTIRLGGDGRVQVMDLGLDQEQPTDDAAVRQLGGVLRTALGDGSREAGLLAVAARASGGAIATLDELLDALRSATSARDTGKVTPRQNPVAPGERPSQAPTTPVARRPAPAARQYSAHEAPTTVVRRPATGRGGGVLLALALGVALLVAIGVAIAGGRPDAGTAAPVAWPDAGQSSPGADPANASAAGTVSQPGTASAAPSGPTYVVAATGSPPQVRLREGPGTNFPRIGALPNGTVVEVIEGPVPGDQYTWVRVRAGTTEGWCILEALRKQ